MAQLKNSLISGDLRVTGTIYGDGSNLTDLNMDNASSGTLPVARGGTGQTSFSSNAVVVGNGSNSLQVVATKSGAAYATATNGALTFGTLPVAQGGTGQTSVANIQAGKDGSGNTITSTYVKKSGDTMTGVLKAYASQYNDDYTTCGINMQNSDIVGLNSIYTADESGNAGEGIHFYRDTTHVDTLWMNQGDLLFVPNRAIGVATTKANSQKVVRMPATVTTGTVLIADGTTGLTSLRTIKNMTSKGDLGWTAAATDIYIPTVNTLAYWNGQFKNGSSNLAYCSKGAFGDLAIKSSIGDHSVTTPTGATSRTADVALNTTSVPNVTAVGSAPSLTYTARSIPNVTTAGTASYANGILTITNTTLGTAIAADDITAWSAGTTPTLGTAITVATSVKTQPTFTVTTETTTLSHTVS